MKASFTQGWPWQMVLGICLMLVCAAASILSFVFTRYNLLNSFIDDLGIPIYAGAGVLMIVAINYLVQHQKRPLVVLIMMTISFVFWLALVISFSIEYGTGCQPPLPGQLIVNCGRMKELFISMIVAFSCLVAAMINYGIYHIFPLVKQGGYKALFTMSRNRVIMTPLQPQQPPPYPPNSYELNDYGYQPQQQPPPGFPIYQQQPPPPPPPPGFSMYQQEHQQQAPPGFLYYQQQPAPTSLGQERKQGY